MHSKSHRFILGLNLKANLLAAGRLSWLDEETLIWRRITRVISMLHLLMQLQCHPEQRHRTFLLLFSLLFRPQNGRRNRHEKNAKKGNVFVLGLQKPVTLGAKTDHGWVQKLVTSSHEVQRYSCIRRKEKSHVDFLIRDRFWHQTYPHQTMWCPSEIAGADMRHTQLPSPHK